jgi:short-subunit dehydrogenase
VPSPSSKLVRAPSYGVGARMGRLPFRSAGPQGHRLARTLLWAISFALVIIARRKERLKHLADELVASHGVEVEAVAADLTEPAGLAAVEARLGDDGRPVDLLVNNAGGESQHGAFLELDRELLVATCS